MGAYQWIICAEVVSSYSFDIVLALMQPVTLFPHHCFYLVGPLRKLSYTVTSTIFKVLACAIILKGYCLLLALLYRYIMSLPPYKYVINRLISWNPWINVLLGALGYAVATGFVLIALFYAEIPQEQVSKDVADESPATSMIFLREPSLLCYSLHGGYGGSVWPLYALFFVYAFGFISLVLILGFFTNQNINSLRSYISPHTQQNHRMLLYAWIAQFACLTTFVNCPILLGYGAIFFGLKGQNHCVLVTFVMCSFHTTSDCLVLLTVVRPYRMCVKRILGQIISYGLCTCPLTYKSNEYIMTMCGKEIGSRVIKTQSIDEGPMSDVLSDFELRVYSHLHTTALCISTSLLIFTATVIVKAPNKNMGTYQWYLLNEVVGSYAFDVCLMVGQPVTLLPNQCGFTLGILRSYSSGVLQFMLKVLASAAVWKLLALFLALSYRYLKSLPPNTNFTQIFLNFNVKTNVGLIVALYLVIDAIAVGCLSLADIPQDTIKYEVTKETPIFYNIVRNEPSTICYTLYPSKYGGSLLPFYLSSVVGALVLAGALIYLGVSTYTNISAMKNFTGSRSQKVHSMLLLAWAAQLLCVILFGGLPLVIGFFVFIFLPPYTNHIMMGLFCVIAFHSIADCIVLLVVVKPYRVFIQRVFLRSREESTSITARKTSRSKSLFVRSSVSPQPPRLSIANHVNVF
uniref:G protein-coupled receptor n=1 Tax=Bursaphelenchus xylophilus TaxID=6326 RepID=A0A1I7SCX5_BURXY